MPADVGLHEAVAAVAEAGVDRAGLERPVERHERRRLIDRPAPGVREPHALELREEPQQPARRPPRRSAERRSRRDRCRGRRTRRCRRHRRSRSVRRRSGAGSRATRARRRCRPARSSRSPPACRGSARSPRRSRRSRRSSARTARMSAAHAPVVSTTRSARIAPCGVRTIAGRSRTSSVARVRSKTMHAALEEHPAQAARQTRRLADRVVRRERAADEPRRVGVGARFTRRSEESGRPSRCSAIAGSIVAEALLPRRRRGRPALPPGGTSSRCPVRRRYGRGRPTASDCTCA